MKFSTLSLAAVGLHGTTAATLRGGDAQRDLSVMYYPRYTGDFNTGWCTSNNNFAQGSPGYATELACCNAAFNGQTTGKCYSMLPSPPTVAPTGSNGPDAWYANYDVDFAVGECINTMPAPIGRTIYDTELECCKGAYGTQTSGACLASLPSPPTVSPTTVDGPSEFYADRTKDYNAGECINTLPVPSGAVLYDSELECCKGEYASQSSGACFASLPSPPTVSPTTVDGPEEFYADRSIDWTLGHCINTLPVPIGAVLYDSELECCKAEYASQSSGACFASLPTPPTVSPTTVDGPDAWYANFDLGWTNGKCINTMPAPIGRTIYDTQLECCKGAYASQESGACFAALPSPPTVSPTTVDGPSEFYADRTKDWANGECINTLPVPIGAVLYDSELECCKGEYASQSSGACFASLPSPPTISPTTVDGPSEYYADRTKDWSVGECTNTLPVPSGAVLYDSELECCKAEYLSQESGACFASLPSPPTVSPTTVLGPEKYYANTDLDWTIGHCINTLPVPNGRTIYDSELECCKGAYGTQASGACLAQLPSPPTMSPLGPGAPFFPIWSGWLTGHCDNDPTKRTSGNSYEYATQAECCEAWFKDQTSNACTQFDPTYGSRSPTQAPVL